MQGNINIISDAKVFLQVFFCTHSEIFAIACISSRSILQIDLGTF